MPPYIGSALRQLSLTVTILAAAGAAAAPLGTGFTYQGQLKDAGQPATGLYDIQVCLFDDPATPISLVCALDIDDVPVADGIFTIAPDFGSAPFNGQARFLELRIRPGASAGAYTVLSPRQLITAAPEALRAATSSTAPWSGLTGMPAGFADGIDNVGVGTVTSISSGAGLTGGPITGSGTLAIATGGVTAVMIAANSIDTGRIIDGSVNPVDIAPDSIGAAQIAVNAIGASELANNAVDTAAIINQSVTEAKIAPGAVGLAQINSSQVQSRILGTCAIGTYLRGVNADGSVLCSELSGPTTTVQLVNGLQSGEYNAIAVGADGLPMVAFSEFNNGNSTWTLRFVKCGDPSCTGPATLRNVDTVIGTNAGSHVSMAIGLDGHPIMSYYKVNPRALSVAKCGDADCSGAITLTVVDDPVNHVGTHTSIAIGNDGRPVISYRDDTDFALKVAKCNNASCTGGSIITTLDNPANQVGEFTSILVPADGLPVISYYDRTGRMLKMARCVNTACTGTPTIANVDNPGIDVGRYTSIATGANGFPLIAYQDVDAGALRVASCGNASCTVSTRVIVDDPANTVGSHTSVVVPADGLPVISYWDSTGGVLKVAKCMDSTCTVPATITGVDAPFNAAARVTSIAIGFDGLPVISYTDSWEGDLRIAKCSTRSCR